MPGVPTSRGCNACRKQKKKCDAGETGAACSRCKRLDIQCEGSGQQRFKFQDESKKFHVADSSAGNNTALLPLHQKNTVVQQLPQTPSNSMTRLASAFVYNLDPSTDITYQLVWNFGPYLIDVPQRLGINPALDASSDALVTAYTNFCAHGPFAPKSELFAKYSRALKLLRETLNDPVKAHSSETLCSTMLLMIVQALTNPTNGFSASHSEGAAQILKSRGFSGPVDDFERNLLLTLRGPVVFEALSSGSKIQYSKREWRLLVASKPEEGRGDANWFLCLACVPDLLLRCERAVCHPFDPDIPALIAETSSLMKHCRVDISALRVCLEDFHKNTSPLKWKRHFHAHHIKMLSLALMTGILVSCIFESLAGEHMRIESETSQWSLEILHLAEVAVQFQPLGSMAMSFPLQAAWMASRTDDVRDRILALAADYEMACLGFRSVGELKSSLKTAERHFRLQKPLAESQSTG